MFSFPCGDMLLQGVWQSARLSLAEDWRTSETQDERANHPEELPPQVCCSPLNLATGCLDILIFVKRLIVTLKL